MAETLGSLCDKLIVTNLKRMHTSDLVKSTSLKKQIELLVNEIDEYLFDSIQGSIPLEKMNFPSHKVFNTENFTVGIPVPRFGQAFSELININYQLWNVQDRVYNFADVPPELKDEIIKELASLNLERNMLIEEINMKLHEEITKATQES